MGSVASTVDANIQPILIFANILHINLYVILYTFNKTAVATSLFVLLGVL
jgi:hypothetical protein